MLVKGVGLVEPSIWKNRSFVFLWLAQITANIGDQFYGIALLWYLLQQTKSAATLSIIAIPEMIAGFLFYMVGGVLADRYNPRTLMVAANIARVCIVLIVACMAVAGVGQLPFFLLTQFCIGIFTTLFQPSRTVALKVIVPIDQLSRANAILDTTFRTVRIMAPMTIGVLASAVPIASLFFVNAASYVLSACFIFAIRQSLRLPREALLPKLTAKQYTADIGTAFREMTQNRSLFYILLFSNMGFLVWQVCWSVGFPVLADKMGNGDAGMLGILVGCYGVGNLLGSLYMARLQYRNHLFVVLMGWLFQSVGFVTLSLGQDVASIVYISAGIAGIGGPLIGIPTVTAIQTKVDNANTGKVYALNMLMFTFFCVSSSTLGALLLGTWSIANLFLVGGLFLLAMLGSGLLLNRHEQQKQQKDQPLST